MLNPLAELERELERLGADGYCADAWATVRNHRELLLPPEDISTKECAANHRYLPNPEGTEKRLYDRSLTPYMDGPQDALDDPQYLEVDVVGPGRTGKSIGGENHLFKRLRNGPLTDTIIYMPAGEDVESYADKEFADFFTLHPEIESKLGTRPTDNKRKFKRVKGRAIQLFPANLGNVRQKQAPLIMATEVDGFRKTVRSAFRNLARTRGRAYGNQFKLYQESHPDAGFEQGIASSWLLSTRGLWYWPCPHCNLWSSPHPLAPKFVDAKTGDKAEMYMRLEYDRLPDADDIDMLDHVKATAGLACPHCGVVIRDDEEHEYKAQMNSAGVWVHEGQVISPKGKVSGAIKPNDTAGFWIHGTMSPFFRWGQLAKEYVEALLKYERSKDTTAISEFTAKSLGEVYLGVGKKKRVLDAKLLREKAADEELNPYFERGTCPPEVDFITAAVDVGGRKFDVAIWGWDLENRSWLIDRFTLFQAKDGRDLRPPERQEDWTVIRDQLLKHLVPLAEDPEYGMPIACVAVDTGGSGNNDENADEKGGVTWKAREFARRMAKSGDSGRNGYRLMLIKGGTAKKAPEIGPAREINKDAEGRKLNPPVKEYTLNVDKLKMLSIERLATDDGGPGQVHYADKLPKSAFDELCGEQLIDGVFHRRGANETLDLFGYAEAARILLQPERADIRWYDDERGPARRPVWARPVRIASADEDEVPKPTKRRKSMSKLAELNRRKR